MVDHGTIYKGVNQETKEFFIDLSKKSDIYHETDIIKISSLAGFSKEEIEKNKTYSIPISSKDRNAYNKDYYKNIEHCFNYLSVFCDIFNLPFKEFKSIPKTTENQNYRMAFVWCCYRRGFDRFVIGEVIYKSKYSIDYYISRMNDIRYLDNINKTSSEVFKIVKKYEKTI